MITHSQMQTYVDQINQKFNVHGCWDGYYIRLFKRKNLVIGGSQDWCYYHNLDVIFKTVIFFDLPSSWRDTEISGEDLFRLANLEEFKIYHPDFEMSKYPKHHIFAIDIHFTYDGRFEKNTYFIVATNVFLEIYTDPIGDGHIEYEDPLEHKGFLCRENRVPLL